MMRQWLGSLSARWFALTTPDQAAAVTTASRERQRKARLLSLEVLCLFILVTPILLLTLTLAPTNLPISLGFELVLMSALWCNRHNKLEIATVIMLSGYLALTTLGLWQDPPHVAVVFLWEWTQFAFPPLIAGSFLPYWSPFVFGIFDMGIVTLLYLGKQQYYAVVTHLPPDTRLDLLLYIAITIMGMAITGAINAHSLAKAIAQADHALELEQAHSELEHAHHHLAEAYIKLEDLATHDPITGLLNHRALHARLDAAIAQAKRSGEPLAVVFADLDHFKQVNDTWGHPAGDSVLAHLAQCLRDALRAADTVARYGGEEFVMLLPEHDAAQARQTAERIRVLVADTPACLAHEQTLAVTLSIDVALFPADGQTAADVLNAADAAMYHAKRGGRNRVCCAADLTAEAAA